MSKRAEERKEAARAAAERQNSKRERVIKLLPLSALAEQLVELDVAIDNLDQRVSELEELARAPEGGSDDD